MRQIEIEERHLLRRHTTYLTMPETADEYTPRQYVALVSLAENLLPMDDFLSRFFGFRPDLLARMSGYQQYKLWEVVEQIPPLALPERTWYVPSVGDGLLSPSPRLRGMTMQQFMTVDTYAGLALYTRKESYLNRFVASLYLRDGESFVEKARYTTPDIDVRSEEVSGIPREERQALLTNWALVKDWLADGYPSLFSRASADSTEKNSKTKPVSWLRLFDAWVGDNVAFMHSYKTMECTDALRILNRKIKEGRR